jgi:hypothetical protein
MEADIMICDIITNDMNLNPKRVVVQNQNYEAPKDQSLYITVRTGSPKVLSVTNTYDNNKEIKQTVNYIPIAINITSRNREAMERKEEVLMALNSTYSRQKQEEYQIKIFRPSQIMDLSFIEGSAGLNRYKIDCIVSQLKTVEKTIDYYDKFRHEEVVE